MQTKPTDHMAKVLALLPPMYLFVREGGFYPLELKNDKEARDNAECNPGTIRVLNAYTMEEVWPNN